VTMNILDTFLIQLFVPPMLPCDRRVLSCLEASEVVLKEDLVYDLKAGSVPPPRLQSRNAWLRDSRSSRILLCNGREDSLVNFRAAGGYWIPRGMQEPLTLIEWMVAVPGIVSRVRRGSHCCRWSRRDGLVGHYQPPWNRRLGGRHDGSSDSTGKAAEGSSRDSTTGQPGPSSLPGLVRVDQLLVGRIG